MINLFELVLYPRLFYTCVNTHHIICNIITTENINETFIWLISIVDLNII